MAKRRYRTIQVKVVDASHLLEQLKAASQRKMILGVDVAKEGFVAAFMDTDERVLLTIRWSHPVETPAMMRLLVELRQAGAEVEVAMEPTGTYGDSVRYQLARAGFAVFRVSAKHVHDLGEVYDGVPSSHDAKAAAIIAKLHKEGRSSLWAELEPERREMKVLAGIHDWQKESYHQAVNRIEGMLARHWPELTRWLELGSATLLGLLTQYGGPREVAQARSVAKAVIRRLSNGLLTDDKIEGVVASAERTQGVPMLGRETDALRLLAEEANRLRRAYRQSERQLTKVALKQPEVKRIASVVGNTTAAVLTAVMGSAQNYPSPSAYVKAMGLNLKVRSSGKHKGELKITKRGSGMERRWLYLAVLRWIQQDPIAAAWHARKVARDGGRLKTKSLVALMRKLPEGLWHVARGHDFDSRKLFDVSLLHVDRQPLRAKGLFGRKEVVIYLDGPAQPAV